MDNKCGKHLHILLMRTYNSTNTLKNSSAVSQNFKHIVIEFRMGMWLNGTMPAQRS
jgi:hypothetical protein